MKSLKLKLSTVNQPGSFGNPLTESGSQKLQNSSFKITIMLAPKGIKLVFRSILRKKTLKHVYWKDITDLCKFIEDQHLSLEEQPIKAA